MKEWRPLDPGAIYVKVFLDGKEIDKCFYCQGSETPGEEHRGEVGFFEVDKYGSILLNDDFEPARKTKKGMVRWEWTGEESYTKFRLRNAELRV